MTEIDDLLRFDALAAAERITGQSYKEDGPTMALGAILHLDASARKREELALRDDTHYGMATHDALRIYAELGFEEIHGHQFEGTYGPEIYRVLWHPDGILATVESYSWTGEKPGVNNTKIYFSHQATDSEPVLWKFPMSGRSPSAGISTGDIDTREGLRHILAKLRDAGEFLNPWVEPGYLSLVDYAQWHTQDDVSPRSLDFSKNITAEVVSTFPLEVRQAIGRG